MRKMWILLVPACVAFVSVPLAAQEPPKPAQEDAGGSEQKDAESRARQETRAFEVELVRLVKTLRAQSKPANASPKPEGKWPVKKATAPSPKAHDRENLRNELAEWKSKSIALLDITKQQKLAELDRKYEQHLKKLRDMYKKPDKIIIDPKRRPGAEREAGELGKALERNLERLNKESEAKRREIEKECRQEKESIERLAREMEKALDQDNNGGSRKTKAPPSKQRRKKDTNKP